MGKTLKDEQPRVYFDCAKCPAYCCSIYDRVQVTQRDINSQESFSARIALGWKATDTLTITPSLFVQNLNYDDGSRYEPHREPIQIEMFSCPFFQLRPRTYQLRRIEHDYVEGPSGGRHVTNVGKRIGLGELDAHLIQIRILLRQLKRIRIQIDAN